MREFSQIFKRLRYLMIQKLPEYIDKINKENNDGIILKPFTNTELIQGNLKIPYFDLNFEESEQDTKDRILGFIRYKLTFELFLEKNKKDPITEFSRYYDAIYNMLHEDDFEYWEHFSMKSVSLKKIVLIVFVEW